jgi:hypothetical protein
MLKGMRSRMTRAAVSAEELVELAVQDVLLRLLGFDRSGELPFPLDVLPFQGTESVVHRGELARRLRGFEVDDGLELGI